MLVYVRHGKTSLNQAGAREALRGWLPVPLTLEGRQQAEKAGEALEGNRFNSFAASDLPRAIETAQIIAPHIGMASTPDSDIRDWNTGQLAGQPFDKVKETLHHYVDHPDEPIPGGEALNDYLRRFIPAMRARIHAPGTHLVVGHARGTSILQGIASPKGGVGGEVDPHYLKIKPNVNPGDIIAIPPSWDIQRLSRPESAARLKAAVRG